MLTPTDVREAARLLRTNAEAATTPEAMRPWGDRTIPSQHPDSHPEMVRGYLGGTWGDYYATMPPSVGLMMAEFLEDYASALVGTNPGDAPFEEQVTRIVRSVLKAAAS